MQIQELVQAGERQAAREEQISALKAACFLPESVIAECPTFRDAVWLAWQRRRNKGLTKSRLAEACDLYAAHVTQFVHPNPLDAKGKRKADLPARKVADFEAAVGNRAVSQWLNRHARLTIMEQMIAMRV